MDEIVKENIKKAQHKRILKKKLGEKCIFCGCENKLLLTIDHKIPRNRGGTDTDDNKQVSCWFCNQLKDSLNNNEFKEYLKSLYKLKDLCKIRILLPQKIDIIFNQHHYPQDIKELEVKNVNHN